MALSASSIQKNGSSCARSRSARSPKASPGSARDHWPPSPSTRKTSSSSSTLTGDRSSTSSPLMMDTFNGVYVTTNPWEAALTPDGKRLFVVYAGTNDMNVCRVIDDDYKEIQAIGLPLTVGQNPRAVRVSPDGKVLFVSNTLDFAVGIYDITADRPRLV